MKHLALAILFTASAWVSAFADDLLPPTLRTNAVITGDTVHLGDLWDNMGDKADTVIAPAPQPGRHVTLDARWLAVVAANNNVDWKPSNPYERTVLERSSQTIDPSLVETELREALALEGLPPGQDFEISNRAALGIVIPSEQAATVAIRELIIDPRTQRFSATVEAPAGLPSATRVRITGRTFATNHVPVLAHPLNRGEIIGENNIQWIDVREDTMRHDVATDLHQLIGMEARAPIKAGLPVRTYDIQRPLLVTRNALVTMVLRTPFMTLTAQAKAEEDGGRGDVIKVTNLQTKQIVEATVEGSNTVLVASNGPRLVAN